MTEAEWETSTDILAMVRQLGRRANTSKLRQFRCACCRRRWGLFTDPRLRAAVETVERYAAGLTGSRALRLAEEEVSRVSREAREAARDGGGGAALVALYAATVAWLAITYCRGGVPSHWCLMLDEMGRVDTSCLIAWSVDVESPSHKPPIDPTGEPWQEYGCRLLRELFGNPFRPVTPDPAWREWNGGALVHLARTIYEEGRFADLPILADALEDAGCASADVLDHCRRGGEHVRGCWVLDLLLSNG
jgi:hypothetical protein